MPDPQWSSARQRLYVHGRLRAARLASEAEEGRRRIEDNPTRSEEEKAKALADLREAVRAHDRALAGLERDFARDGEEPPSGALYERIAAAVEGEEAEGVDVLAEADAELGDRLGRAEAEAGRLRRRLAAAEAGRAGRRPPV